MKYITNPMACLIAVAAAILSMASYALIAPLWNVGGICEEPIYITMEPHCGPLFGIALPEWWRVGVQTLCPVAPIFGVFIGVVTAIVLLYMVQVKSNKNTQED